jgi:hypothetical protein
MQTRRMSAAASCAWRAVELTLRLPPTAPPSSKASANFKHELASLRSSFRFNEYDPILASALSPVAKVS